MEPEALNPNSSLNLDDSAETAKEDTAVWQRGGRVFADGPQSHGDGRSGDILTKDFLRKYIHYAKNRVHPVLSADSMESISSHYTSMRSRTTQKNLPITPRTLETIIRLSSASAKARLSGSVDQQDVDVAMQLLNFVIFHEIGALSSDGDGSGHRSGDGGSENGSGGSDKGISHEGVEKGDGSDYGEDSYPQYDDNDDDNDDIDKNDPRYLIVMSTIRKIQDQEGLDEIPLDDVLSRINSISSLSASSQSSGSSRRLTQNVAERILRGLQRENKVMYQDGIVHTI